MKVTGASMSLTINNNLKRCATDSNIAQLQDYLSACYEGVAADMKDGTLDMWSPETDLAAAGKPKQDAYTGA